MTSYQKKKSHISQFEKKKKITKKKTKEIIWNKGPI
jgi:hypothetical protein